MWRCGGRCLCGGCLMANAAELTEDLKRLALRFSALYHDYATAHHRLVQVQAIVEHARKVSPSEDMTVRVTEIERALGAALGATLSSVTLAMFGQPGPGGELPRPAAALVALDRVRAELKRRESHHYTTVPIDVVLKLMEGA
jgi:hypothetical protein